jgi:hypothetical protein
MHQEQTIPFQKQSTPLKIKNNIVKTVNARYKQVDKRLTIAVNCLKNSLKRGRSLQNR